MGIVRACLRELPILTAEESFLAVDRMAIATASYEKNTRAEIMQKWRLALDSTDDAPAQQRPARTAADIRAAGILVFSPKPTSD